MAVFRFLLKRQENKRNNNRVLVQMNSGIGDAILALPLIHELAINKYEVHTLVNKYTEFIAMLCPEIKSTYVVNYRTQSAPSNLRLVWNLNKLSFRYFIGALPSNLIRDVFLPLILRIPIRIKHISPHKEWYRNYDFIYNRLGKIGDNRNNADSNMMLMSLIDENVKIGEKKFKIHLPEDLIHKVKRKLERLGYSKEKITVGIHPGCNMRHLFKRWPVKNFVALIDLLSIQNDAQVILFGGQDDIDLAEPLVQNSTIKPFSLINQLSLQETMCAISFCSLFISNDSGLMHIASVFDIPVIALFGGRSSAVLTGPNGQRSVIIKKDDIHCIFVNEVYQEAVKILSNIGKEANTVQADNSG